MWGYASVGDGEVFAPEPDLEFEPYRWDVLLREDSAA